MRHEIKLLLSNRMNKILLIFLFAISVSFSIFAAWSISFVDDNGNTHNGIFAPRKLSEKKSKYVGKLNPDVFEDVIKKLSLFIKIKFQKKYMLQICKSIWI